MTEAGGARGLWHVSRFLLESRRPGPVAEPAVLRRIGRLRLRRGLYVCHFGLRHQIWIGTLRPERLRWIPADHLGAQSGRLHRNLPGPEHQFQVGPHSAVQRQSRAAASGKHRADRRVRRLAQLAYPGGRQQYQRGVAGSLWNGQGLHPGMRAGRRGVRRAVPAISVFHHLQRLRQRSRALQFAADQSRNQERAARHLRAGRLHLRARLRQRVHRWPGHAAGRHLLPAAQLAEPGLGALANQPEPRFHGQRNLRTARSARASTSGTPGVRR